MQRFPLQLFFRPGTLSSTCVQYLCDWIRGFKGHSYCSVWPCSHKSDINHQETRSRKKNLMIHIPNPRPFDSNKRTVVGTGVFLGGEGWRKLFLGVFVNLNTPKISCRSFSNSECLLNDLVGSIQSCSSADNNSHFKAYESHICMA